jgi:hypothetical protein
MGLSMAREMVEKSSQGAARCLHDTTRDGA